MRTISSHYLVCMVAKVFPLHMQFSRMSVAKNHEISTFLPQY